MVLEFFYYLCLHVSFQSQSCCIGCISGRARFVGVVVDVLVAVVAVPITSHPSQLRAHYSPLPCQCPTTALPRELERAGKWLHQRQSSPADTLGSNISGGRKRNAGQSFPADSHTLDNNISLPQQGTEEKTKKIWILSILAIHWIARMAIFLEGNCITVS